MTADTEETVAAAEKGGPKSGSAGGKQEAGPGTAAEGQGNATGAPQKTVATMLGEAVWLLSQSSTHKYFTLADLEWLLMPPILLQQFRVYYHEEQPQAIALWAFLSEDAERRLDMTAMSGQGARLAPNDWKSGDHLWLVDLVVPNSDREGQATKLMLADLAKNVFPGRSMKMHVTDPATGKREVKVIGS